MQKTRYFPGSVDEECDLSLQGERNFPLLSSNSNCGQSAESKEEERLSVTFFPRAVPLWSHLQNPTPTPSTPGQLL